MIVMNLKLDHIYGFEDFEIDFTYPKKVVNSIIDEEYLKGRERFRYKKAVILMGANATGKTSLGRALHRIISYINTSNPAMLFEMVSDSTGSLSIDFVNEGFVLHRLTANIDKLASTVEISYSFARINKMDSYESCVEKLEDHTAEAAAVNSLKKLVGPISCRFAYPDIETSMLLDDIDREVLLKTLRAVIGTLDPTLCELAISRDLKDTFIIRRENAEIIIQEGKILNRELLSSGTAEGIEVALFLASMLAKNKTFYYCDEHFSYIQSDIEKRIFGLMLERIDNNEQLIFTTHNTDMLDLNLPKHSYMFLRKKVEDGGCRVSAISASEMLKRNTDNIRNAVENDVFDSLPDDSLLDELEMGT
ncbi:MAG: DNA repair protein Rad50 [Anaerovoracaceae bacterium]